MSVKAASHKTRQRGKDPAYVRLTLHWTYTSVLEEQPIIHLLCLARAARVRDLVIRVILLDKILQDASGFEQTDLLTVREGVRNGRDATIRIDFQEPGLLLGVLPNVDFVNLVRKPRLHPQLANQPRVGLSCRDIRWESHPNSSSAMEILMPLGVWVVYSVISGFFAAIAAPFLDCGERCWTCFVSR